MSRWSAVALYCVGTVFSGAVLLPLFWMLVTALRPSAEILVWPPRLIPRTVTASHFQALWQETNFSVYLMNSMVIALAVVLLVNLAALGGGYSLSRSRSRSVRAVGFLSLLGYMITPIMIVIPFYLILRSLDLANSLAALILAHTAFCLPFALWLIKSYIDDVPKELENAARVDGAGRLATLILVVLPEVRPGIAAISIFTFILSWNDYIFARILISNDALKTVPVGIEDIFASTVVDWGLLMAAGVAATVPVLVGFAVVHRTAIKGWGHSGLKG